ncbi:MAG: RNA 2',3'-cyclic phosphodiesterase [Chloroflexi bacterium]|nr:RNA 2',3'-cyclic phosphodiesterase [Chloroflexota bacterium]
MRAFVAVELDDAARDLLAHMLRGIQSANPPVKLKWVAPQNQHLTLYFFANLAPARVADVERALQTAVSGVAPFELTLGEIDCFPNAHKPNVLWLGVREPSGTLMRLHKAVSEQVARIGFAPELRAFTPHLTLARVPRHVNSRERRLLGEWFMQQSPPVLQAMRVAQVHFIQSELLPTGPRYTTLHVAPIASER